MLSNNEITNIYTNHIAINYTQEYANRYVPLPLEYNNKNWKWEGKDFPRIISLLEFRKYMIKYDKTFDNVLSFNGASDPEYEYLKYNKIHNYQYSADVIKNDLHTLNLDKKDFDFAMINQTIEHLYDPITALKNIYNHMKIGGMFYTNVPSNNIPHSTPFHYYTGLTPTGLGVITKLAGFDILEIGQWGNREYLNVLFSKGWTDYKYSDRPGWNEINCPLITWILAIKN